MAQPVTRPEALPEPAADGLPDGFVPWWQQQMNQQLKDLSNPLEMTLDNAVVGTLMHSPQVRVLADSPIIRRSTIMQAQGKFDLHSFAETKFVNTSDPVGSTLTTGGANRFLDQNVYASAGVRQQTATGAQVEMSQRIGYQQNNSIYFSPNDQGTSRLTLTLTQPLLNGRGRAYNNSMIMLAKIDTSIASDQLSRDLQALLVELHQTYWDLYQQRAVLLQKRRLYEAAIGIRDHLQGRKDVDVVRSQLVRAEAAVANREAATIRYRSQIRNAEARLRALVNDPMILSDQIELVPAQVPNQAYVHIDLQQSLISALEGRPEVTQAGKQVRAASLRMDMSKNELLPVLNLVLGTYVYGLVGQGDIAQAYGNQFSVGRPTYSGGFTFDVPYNNYAARGRLQQRKVEVRQLCNQLQATMNKIRAEVEIAVREVDTTYREMASKYRAMVAGQAEIDYLTERWQLLPGDQQVAGVMLDDLLNAQERLADTEASFVQAVVAYNVALVNQRRITGTLLDYEDIRELDGRTGGVPQTTLIKGTPQPAAPPPMSVPQQTVAQPQPVTMPAPPAEPIAQPPIGMVPSLGPASNPAVMPVPQAFAPPTVSGPPSSPRYPLGTAAPDVQRLPTIR
jgi:outer membrane protein TolC